MRKQVWAPKRQHLDAEAQQETAAASNAGAVGGVEATKLPEPSSEVNSFSMYFTFLKIEIIHRPPFGRINGLEMCYR
jgi:hypothetical protein